MNETSNRILILEDDSNITALLRFHLEERGHSVDSVAGGDEALELAKESKYDLLLLDIAVAGLSGLEVCKELRNFELHMPILMLTSRGSESDKVAGLQAGADDYVAKPFSVLELLARIDALLRRSQQFNTQTNEVITLDTLSVDPQRRVVTLGDEHISLTEIEFDLLYYLVKKPGHVYSRSQLLKDVWGYDHEGYDKTVNTHINRLRNKIEKDPDNPKFILTVWGVGYRSAEKSELL